MDIRRRVGLNVRKFREDRNVSQEQLAFDCGLHRTYVSGIERGIRNPTVTSLQRLAKALKVTPSALLEDASRK
jgi:transcriptional regulator with XRE-family HTH domain